MNLYGFVGNESTNAVDILGLIDGKDFEFAAALKVKFGFDSHGLVYEGVDFGIGINGRCVENANIRLDLNGSVYTGGIGTRTGLIGISKSVGYNLSGTVSVTLGTGESRRMPVHLSNNQMTSSTGNSFNKSLTLGQAYNWNSELGGSRIGILGLRVGDFAASTSNDFFAFPSPAGGSTDHSLTGGLVLTGRLNSGLLELSYQDFTGIGMSNPGSIFAPMPIGPHGTQYQIGDLDLNRADTSLRYSSDNGQSLTLGFSGPGWGQNAVHYLKNIQRFLHSDRRVFIEFQQTIPQK